MPITFNTFRVVFPISEYSTVLYLLLHILVSLALLEQQKMTHH